MFELDIARRHVVSNRRGTAFTLISITIAVGIIIMSLGLTEGVRIQIVQDTIDKSPHLIIKPKDGELWSDLGDCFQGQGKLQDALDAYNESLKFKPNEAATFCKIGEVAKQQGQVKVAIEQQRKALAIKSDFVPSLNNLAWILATSKDSQIRNPSEAVPLAQKACEATSSKDFNCLDTLAAAYAGAGQFDKAVETAQKAVALARAAKDNESVQDISKKLQLYQIKQPYLEP